jgi:Lrp/AsnC family transcriptional regulator for asnA, asnC and gidA
MYIERVKIDAIDKKILEELMNNARIPYLEIGRIIGISGAAVHQRVQKLEDSGIIQGSRTIINPKKLGFNTSTFVGVFLDQAGLYDEVVNQLNNIPEVVECHYTTGNYSVFLKILCENNDDLLRILNKSIQQIPGVARTETFITLDQPIDKQVPLK